MSLLMYIGTAAAILLVYILQKVFTFVWNVRQLRKALLNVFPHPEYHPIMGHLMTDFGSSDEGLKWQHEMVKRFPRYYVLLVGPFPVLQLNHPETVKILAKTAEPKPTEVMGGYSPLVPWIGYGLLNSYGHKWARNRRLLTPGFHFDVLKPYVAIYNDSVEKFMRILEETSTKPGKSVEVFNLVCHHAFEVILRCAFSSEEEVQGTTQNDYVKAVTALGFQTVERALNPLYMPDLIFYNTKLGKEFSKNCKLSHDVAEGVIKKRRKELTESKETLEKVARKRYIDFLDILLLARDEHGE